jgi:hypothetical protein
MRHARIIVAAVAVWGCSNETAPSTPASPLTPGPASLWGMVVEDSGLCIAGAAVRVVGGQAIGRNAVQEGPCDAWGYGGGFLLTGLTPGVAMTLRVSAPGYAPKDTTVLPRVGAQTALLITPSRE